MDGVPVWPMIYYCLRCGDIKAAILAANKSGPGLSEVAQLLTEISSSGDGRLSAHTENVVRISYRRSIRSTTDPFKRAVYCILAACDPADEHSEVATSLDDYLWIKLAQVIRHVFLIGNLVSVRVEKKTLLNQKFFVQ